MTDGTIVVGGLKGRKKFVERIEFESLLFQVHLNLANA